MYANRAERSRLAVTRLKLTNFRSYGFGEIAVSGVRLIQEVWNRGRRTENAKILNDTAGAA